MTEIKKEIAQNGDQIAADKLEQMTRDKMGCVYLDPVRGCVPRSGKCDKDCPGNKQKATVEKYGSDCGCGCGGQPCFKP